MKPLTEIRTRDSKNLPHGYQEAKIFDKVVYRYKAKNGLEVGYYERHGSEITEYHIR